MFESALHRRVALAALVALVLSVGAAPASASDVSTSTGSVSGVSATDTEVNATVVYEGDRVVLHPSEGQTVRLRTNADPGTEFSVELWSNGTLDKLARPTVSEEGPATATLDLTSYDVGTEVRVVVRHDDVKVGQAPAVVTPVTTEFVHEGKRPILRAAANQTVTVRTDAEPGRELSIRLKTHVFVRTTTAVVAEDDIATATFDLRDVAAGKEFTASVFTSLSGERTEIEGLLVNESATVHRDATFAVPDPDEEVTIRGHVADPTVTKLDVRYAPEGVARSSLRTVAVGDEGRFAATLDLSSVSVGDEVSVEVGGIPREVDEVVVTEASGEPTVYAFVETPLQLRIQRPEDEVLVHATPNQTIRGTTNLRPGAQVVVTAEGGAMNAPTDFSLSETATVREDGTFAATLDFGEAEAGTNFTVTVERGLTLTEVKGRVVNDSVEVPTTTARPTTTTARPTTVNESDFPFTTTRTTTPDDGSDGHVDEFGVPGFGIPVALLALLAGLALARPD